MLRAFTWSLTGAVVGGMAGYAGLIYGQWSAWVVWALAIAGMLTTFVLPLVITAVGGGAARNLYNPSGGGTPHRPEYSHAESLAARGLYDEAVAAFEVAITSNPTDPQPYLRVARIHRDRSKRFEDAGTWFRKALEQTPPGSGLALLVVRETVELYTGKLNAPARVTPLLARLADEREGMPEGTWAREELARVKAELAGGAPS